MSGFNYTFNIDFAGGSEGSRITSSLIASGAQTSEHIKSYDVITRNRLQSIDLTPLLVYMIDTVPADVLPALAEQFDVLGYKGWRFADTEQKKRDLIKNAIELHRTKGTPWSIKEAVKRIGFADAEIIEGFGIYYNGQASHNGAIKYAGLRNRFNFRVVFDLGNYKGISAQQTADLQALVNEYKNVRSHLIDISFKKSIVDEVFMTEQVKFTFKLKVDERFSGNLYNGSIKYNGKHYHAAMTDDVTIVQK